MALDVDAETSKRGQAAQTAKSLAACLACGGSQTRVFFEAADIPVHCNILWPTQVQAALAPRGSMRLNFCEVCGLVFNAAFDQTAVTYDPAYENSLHGSLRFQRYAKDLSVRLANRCDLRGRLVVEVGCGKGEFLRLLCRVADAEGVGLDPSYDPSLWLPSQDSRVQFVQAPLSTFPDNLRPSLIVCRHVLEHVPDPRAFVADLAAAARRGPGCVVFVEVPDALYTLRDLGIWDLIYEHCTYFSAPALARLFADANVEASEVWSTFGGQFLCFEGVARSHGSRQDRDDSAVASLARLADAFSNRHVQKVQFWSERLRELMNAGRRAVVWGAGSKGISFVNVVPGAEKIACLVDINPRKHNRFVPITAQPVVSPSDLPKIQPDLIVIMNSLYRDEIAARIRELGLSADIEAV